MLMVALNIFLMSIILCDFMIFSERTFALCRSVESGCGWTFTKSVNWLNASVL